MAELRYDLIKSTGEVITADPRPTGWERPVISLQRDSRWHGIFFDYGLNDLSFRGSPADIIREEWEAEGVNGQMQLRILYRCSDGQFDEIYLGKLNFTRYRETCGIECSVSIGLEDNNDVMLFRNNYNQKVNLNSNLAFDQVTTLTDYTYLNFDMTIPGRGLPQQVSGSSAEGQHPFYPITVTWPGISNAVYIRPVYINNQRDEIEDGNLLGGSAYGLNQNQPPHPAGIEAQLTLNVDPACTTGDFTYSVRLKGHIREATNSNRTVSIYSVVTTFDGWDNIADPSLHITTLLPITNYTAATGPDFDFDQSYSGSTTITEGQSFAAFIFVVITPNAAGRTSDIFMDWDAETEISISTVSLCDPTPAKVTMINEAASRCVEAITNDGIRFYSQTFGRTDSQPYAIDSDTCAGLMSITNGLNVRRKLLADDTQPGFFKSMQEIFEEMTRLWNIGLTIEDDPNRTGFRRLRFENWEYFYQNDVGLILPAPMSIVKSVDLNRIFNRMTVGYNKWEAEQVTGLDEFMTTREYRLDINAIDKPLELNTDLICSPYTIEITRRQAQQSNDWKYDNDTMGFCVVRGGANFIVEQFQGTTSGVENVSDPGTCYNARVRPSVIAMRWFNYVVQGIKAVTASTRLIFSKGVGNYIAKLKTNTCNIEGQPISESEDIDITDFDNPQEAQPITQPELDTLNVSLPYSTFKQLKDDPTLRFKTIKYPCNGVYREGWINSLQYNLEDGSADFEMIPKNDLQIVVPVPPCSATVVPGSVIVTVIDQASGTISVDFTEGVGGADNWQYAVTGMDLQGNTNVHPFQISGIPPGEYTVGILPYCGTNIGQNVAFSDPFVIEEAQMMIELRATQVPAGSFIKFRITATRVGGGSFLNNFSFRFGQCQTGGGTFCNGFPSAPFNQNMYATVNGFVGGTSAAENMAANALPGSTLDSVTLHNLVGITQTQISKAAGETWVLNFE